MPEAPGFNLTLAWPNGTRDVYAVHNQEPLPAAPFTTPGCWGIDVALGALIVNAQRVRVAGGQLTGPAGAPVLVGAPLGALLPWAVEPA